MNDNLDIIISSHMYDEQLFEEYTGNTAKPLLFITNISCLLNITTEYFTDYCDSILSKYITESYIWTIVCNGELENASHSVKMVLYVANLMSSTFQNSFEKLYFLSPCQCIHKALYEEWSKIPCHLKNIIVISNYTE